jgi:hypothetical protein
MNELNGKRPRENGLMKRWQNNGASAAATSQPADVRMFFFYNKILICDQTKKNPSFLSPFPFPFVHPNQRQSPIPLDQIPFRCRGERR